MSTISWRELNRQLLKLLAVLIGDWHLTNACSDMGSFTNNTRALYLTEDSCELHARVGVVHATTNLRFKRNTCLTTVIVDNFMHM